MTMMRKEKKRKREIRRRKDPRRERRGGRGNRRMWRKRRYLGDGLCSTRGQTFQRAFSVFWPLDPQIASLSLP